MLHRHQIADMEGEALEPVVIYKCNFNLEGRKGTQRCRMDISLIIYRFCVGEKNWLICRERELYIGIIFAII